VLTRNVFRGLLKAETMVEEENVCQQTCSVVLWKDFKIRRNTHST